MKNQIIERLGQSDILLGSLIADGLSANDRVKARLGVLQAAGRRARNPGATHFDLTEECRAAGVDPVAMEALVNHARLSDGDSVVAPALEDLKSAIWDDVAAMARAVKAGDNTRGDAALERLNALKTAAPVQTADAIGFAQIAQLTGIGEDSGDSLHRLVMDLHKALNRLTAEHAEEVLAGAHVYGLTAEDRPAVEAFMGGLESTRRLKFDHPGLATTATRCGARLTIQNDIGETDAHVIVISVERDAVTVTYTDVHRARAKFFAGLFRDFAVDWSGLDRKSAEGLDEDGVFYLITGRCPIDSDKDRNVILEAIGASLVFLIDWNKARKALRNWVSNGDAIGILDWTARKRFGQRAFLELGGVELVASAVRHAAPGRIGFGERLENVLGRGTAVEFLKTTLRVSAEALLQGHSVRLVRDRIEAELVRNLQRADTTLLATVIRQAGLARDIASAVSDFVAQRQARHPFDRAALAARARHIEEKADRIAIEARNEIARFAAPNGIEPLVNRAEEAIDELEQAAFIASLTPGELDAGVLEPLAKLCAAAVTGAEAAATGIAAAIDIPDGHRIDADDALAAVGRLIEAEHDADDAERTVTAIVLGGAFDLKTSLSVLELARAIERATDRLAGFGHLLRAHVLANLSA